MRALTNLLFIFALATTGCRATTSTECVDPNMPGPDCTAPADSASQTADASPVVKAKDFAPVAGEAIFFTGLTSTEVTVNWGAATDDITKAEDLQYRVLRANGITDIKNPAKVAVALDWTKAQTSLKVGQLVAGTSYYFMVLVKDAVGNTAFYEPKAATPKIVQAGSVVDDTAPVPGTLSFSNTTTNSMTVSWTAGSDETTNASKLRYQLRCLAAGETDLAKTIGILTWEENALTKDLAGLAASTSYVCTVLVKDLAGNEAVSSPVAGTTNAEEAAPPPAPTVTVTTPNGGETKFRNTFFDITWTTAAIDAEELLEVSLSLDDGATWTTLSTTVLAGAGVVQWASGQLSNVAKVRVTVASNQALTDQSDATFRIVPGNMD